MSSSLSVMRVCCDKTAAVGITRFSTQSSHNNSNFIPRYFDEEDRSIVGLKLQWVVGFWILQRCILETGRDKASVTVNKVELINYLITIY